MANDHYRKLGAAFLIASGFIHAIERVGTKIAYGIERTGGNPSFSVSVGFFDNIFVPALTFVGVILFVYGFPKKEL
ncbi:hypothetical protein [Cohnella sp.]|uniref:hypothetical protein n=1 Tax=Cohnella sp. TaxID=1883426 RepID=UPI003564FFE5